MVLFMEGKHVNVPVMSGNTSDEFPSYIEASSKEDLKRKQKRFSERMLRPFALSRGNAGGF